MDDKEVCGLTAMENFAHNYIEVKCTDNCKRNAVCDG